MRNKLKTIHIIKVPDTSTQRKWNYVEWDLSSAVSPRANVPGIFQVIIIISQSLEICSFVAFNSLEHEHQLGAFEFISMLKIVSHYYRLDERVH